MIETGNRFRPLKVVAPCVAVVAALILLVPAQVLADWDEYVDGDVDVVWELAASCPMGNVLPGVDGIWREGYAQTEVLTSMWVDYFWDPDTNSFVPDYDVMYGKIYSSGHDVFEWAGEDTSTGGTAYYSCEEYVSIGSVIDFVGASSVRGATAGEVECSVSGVFPSSLWAETWIEAYMFGVDDLTYDFGPQDMLYEWVYGSTYPVYNQYDDSIYGSCGASVLVSIGTQYTQIPAGTLVFGLTDIEVMSEAISAMETDNSGCGGVCSTNARSHITWDLSYSEQ